MGSTEEKTKIRPFNVMDQTVAHRLALEGFKIISVVPSNKYAKQSHFIFSFDSSATGFKKRFKEILAEVEAVSAKPGEEAEKIAALAEENEALKSEIEKLKAAKCEENAENHADNEKNSHESVIKCDESVISSENSAILDENCEQDAATSETCSLEQVCSGNEEVLTKLAELQALSNCILSTVSAVAFKMSVYKNKEEGE